GNSGAGCLRGGRQAAAGRLTPAAAQREGASDRVAVQVVFVRIGDAHADQAARADRPLGLYVHVAVDLGRIGAGAAHDAFVGRFIDQHIDFAADAGLQARRRNLLLVFHEAFPAFLLDLVGHRAVQRVGRRALYRRILETADAVELGFAHPVEQVLEIFFGFTRKTYDERRAQRQVGAFLTPALDARQRFVFE